MPAAAPLVAQALYLPTEVGGQGLHLFLRRLPTGEARKGLLAAALRHPSPADRRRAFVAGTLCTPDGTPLTLPPDELARLDALGPDEWDDVLTKAAHLNGFAPRRILLG